MNIPLLTKLAHLIEEIFKAEAPVAENIAITTVESDPKVQAVTAASLAMLQAAKDLKAASAAVEIPEQPTPNE
jgi:hypothetical protein